MVVFPQHRTKPLRILIGHLTSNGDILYSSAVARQIKEIDYPGCHLTWAVSNRCAKTLHLNPYIDEVWEYSIGGVNDVTIAWDKFCKEAVQKKEEGIFDIIYLIQLIGDNLLQYNKTIRLSVLAGYPKSLTVPLEPVIRLSGDEIDNVGLFKIEKKLEQYNKVVLFECAPLSGQSLVTPQFALDVLEIVNKHVSGVCFILSSNIAINSSTINIINASELSFRENAELSKYCDLLIGCSSGITWLLTSDWAKSIPTIQLLNKKAVWFNSVVKDYEVRGKDASYVLEMYKFSVRTSADCVIKTLTDGFENTRRKYHQPYNRYWCPTEVSILFRLLKQFRVRAFLKFSHRTVKNNSLVFLIVVYGKLMWKCITSFKNKVPKI